MLWRPPEVPFVRYVDYRRDAQTMDLLLWTGVGLVEATLKLAQRHWATHVSLVVRAGAGDPDGAEDLVMTWESTTLAKVRQMKDGEFVRGVQIHPLSLRLATHRGQVFVRRLDVDAVGPVSAVELMRLRKEWQGRPYEENLRELLLAAYDGPLGMNTEDLSSLFCSEMVAAAIRRLGIHELGPEPNNEFVPADFASDRDGWGRMIPYEEEQELRL
jgi:hypothetical protein